MTAMLGHVVNHRRKVPIPRRMIRYLAASRKPAVVAATLGLCLRGLYYRGGRCHARGTCKASWIADVFGVDVRSVKRARQELADLGWVEAVAKPHWHRPRSGKLAGAMKHFVKVTRSYWAGLFHCYAIAGLPRTNNDLEQLFGSHRYHERRATGRRNASPAMVLRGPVRLVAATSSRLQSFSGPDLAPNQPRSGGRCEGNWNSAARPASSAAASAEAPRPTWLSWKTSYSSQLCRPSFFHWPRG